MSGVGESHPTIPVTVATFGGEQKTVHVRTFTRVSDIQIFCALWPDMEGMAELATTEPAGWASGVTPDSVFCVVAKACQLNRDAFANIAAAADLLKGASHAAAHAPNFPTAHRRHAPIYRRRKS